jgi:hypothetical protein
MTLKWPQSRVLLLVSPLFIIIVVVVVVVIIIIIIVVVVVIVIIISSSSLDITFMQGIYNYIPETNHVSKEYSVVAVLYVQFVLHVMLFRL